MTSNSTTAAGSGVNAIYVNTASGNSTINATTVAASGANSLGINVQGGSGTTTITSGTVSTSNAASGNAIAVSSGSGAVTVNATNTSAAGASAINLTAGSGNVTVNLADGGSTTSGNGAGLYVSTSGTATINLGSAATSASISGAYGGIISQANGGQTLVLSGTVGAGNNQAVLTAGGPVTLTNKGTINGFITLLSRSNVVNNLGTINSFGGDSAFSRGNINPTGLPQSIVPAIYIPSAVLNNSGTINVAPAAVAATTINYLNLTTLNNSGTISLINGHTGDVLNIGTSAFVGSGSSKLALDANLGTSAIGVSAAQTADMLVMGAASGVTTIAVNDLNPNSSGQFNFAGIRLVTNASAAPGSFVLQGGQISKGFASYQLVQDTVGNWDLVGAPSTQAFELVRTGAEAQNFWRRSGDAWAEQMRVSAIGNGPAVWMQVLGGAQTDKSSPVYSATIVGQTSTFTPNLNTRNEWVGAQFGGELSRDIWAVGVTGGYADQTGRIQSTGDQIKLNGANIGAYMRFGTKEGFFLNALGKIDFYKVNYNLSGGAVAPSFDGKTYGAYVQAGYHYITGKAFIEPELALSVTDSDLNGFTAGSGGMAASFGRNDSTFGRAGLRAGLESKSGKWIVRPYVGAAWEGELRGTPQALLTSGGSSISLNDTSAGGHARLEAGVEGTSQTGLSAFAKVEGVTGSKTNGISGRAGFAFRW